MICELFPFQKQAVNEMRLRVAMALNNYRMLKIPQVVSLQAPTGSGKTIIMSALIEDIFYGSEQFTEQPEAIFVWLSDSPQLNEQSKQKIELKADKVRMDQCVVISDESFDREILEDGHIYFLNTQKLGKAGNLSRHSDTRQYTIWETIENTAREKADRLYFIIDEAHRGMQGRQAGTATTIMQRFIKGSSEQNLSPIPVVIGMSATAERFNSLVGQATNSTLHKVVISPAQVRQSGLLKDRIVITYPEDPIKHGDMAVLQAATDEWQDKCKHWYQYACLRDESGYQTKKIRATDKLLSSTKDKVAGFINCTYLADDAEFDTSENIADNKKEFYEISLIENYRPFIFLDDAEKRTEYYSESDRNKLSGFLFRINLNDKYFWVYQHIYSVSRIDRSKNVIALFVGDTYDEIDSDIVQIDSRADVIIFSSSVVTAKMDLMQRFFGFEQYIRAGAQKTIEIIRDLDIVDSLEKFVAFENKSKLTNAKKLLKAKNSPVLQMKKNDLLENLKKHSRYKTMFKFEEDHIVISSQKEAAAFIKMLNDDIVRSELTGKEYDSSSKMLLGPVGASH